MLHVLYEQYICMTTWVQLIFIYWVKAEQKKKTKYVMIKWEREITF